MRTSGGSEWKTQDCLKKSIFQKSSFRSCRHRISTRSGLWASTHPMPCTAGSSNNRFRGNQHQGRLHNGSAKLAAYMVFLCHLTRKNFAKLSSGLQCYLWPPETFSNRSICNFWLVCVPVDHTTPSERRDRPFFRPKKLRKTKTSQNAILSRPRHQIAPNRL